MCHHVAEFFDDEVVMSVDISAEIVAPILRTPRSVQLIGFNFAGYGVGGGVVVLFLLVVVARGVA